MMETYDIVNINNVVWIITGKCCDSLAVKMQTVC